MTELFYDNSKYSRIENRINYSNLILDSSNIVSLNNNFSSILPLIFTVYYFIEYINTYKVNKEFYEVEKQYKSIINDFVNLTKSLNLNNPIELATLFNYTYKNGYLSINHKYEYNTKKLDEHFSLLGATIITGRACCRHSSAFLNDVYRKRHIESYKILTGMNTKQYKKSYSIKNKYSLIKLKQELKKIKLPQEEVIKFINKKHPNLISEQEISSWKYPIHSIPTNHSIVLIKYNNEVYYIDPTNEVFYDYLQDQDVLVSGDFQNVINIEDNRKIIRRKINSLLKYSQAEREKLNKIEHYTKTLCEDNKDLLELFYQEHFDNYQSINEKIKLLQK